MTDELVRKLNLIACAAHWRDQVEQQKELKTDALSQVVAAHLRNVRRVWLMTAFPAVAVHASGSIGQIMTKESFDLYRRKERLPNAKYFERLSVAVGESIERRERIISAGGLRARAIMKEEFEEGFKILEDSIGSSVLAEGAEAWMAAQITGTWTAFESMAEALWIAALNAHPQVLAELKGSKKGGGKDDEPKAVPLHLLQQHRYDLSRNMGDILSRRYSFDRLEDMRRAYADASFEKSKAISKIMADKVLDAISLVRNVIVHNGGIVDQQYLKRTSDLPPKAITEAGSVLPIDGELVAALVAPVLKLSWDLIEAVDEWLAQRGVGRADIWDPS